VATTKAKLETPHIPLTRSLLFTIPTHSEQTLFTHHTDLKECNKSYGLVDMALLHQIPHILMTTGGMSDEHTIEGAMLCLALIRQVQ